MAQRDPAIQGQVRQGGSSGVWLETQDLSHVLATRLDDDIITTDAGTRCADEVIAELPARSWRRLSVGAGSHGLRGYAWARVPIRICWAPGRGHWLLARRSTSSGEIAYYIYFGPPPAPPKPPIPRPPHPAPQPKIMHHQHCSSAVAVLRETLRVPRRLR
ncbi:hypothetical protein GTZ78_45855 [Streptomyces sp. SID8361]|nr:hypothetical protein [Streptomyces sp. SID8361]